MYVEKAAKTTFVRRTHAYNVDEIDTWLSRIILQSNSVITNSMGPLKSVRHNREIVITVKVYVVNVTFGTRKVELYLFVIAVNSL